ncbi:MAG: LuxR family transcriptional regulator, partial [Actinomycetia bacterium]|nr:LuxR family transcriptional regulator [Actinomycetes bacterium]
MAQTPDERDPAPGLHRHLRHLAELAREAGAARDPEPMLAAILAAQRTAAWALRAGIERARQSGSSWRDLATVLGVPPATLHRQFQQGGGLFPQPGEPEPEMTPARPATDRPQWTLPPRPLDLFVGRARELADLGALLPRRRLVTVWGPPGVGKSRLALELAHQSARRFTGGVCWAGLGPVADPDRLPGVLAAALGAPGQPLADAAAAACAHGPVLLVADDCEHLAGACGALLATLLAEHPRLTAVATSRAALRIAGEARVRADPLPVGGPAERLFAERAREAAHDFDADGHEDLLADICAALDGLPLAIELAAQQCAFLPLQAVRSGLGQRLDLDSAGGVPGRHGSLRDSIAWSYGLLGEPAQRVFRRLAILPGGADEITAAALAGGVPRPGQVLAGLAAASLLVPDDTVPDEGLPGERAPGRFRMLGSVRDFGREQLAAAGETGEVHELLLGWLAGRARILLGRRGRAKDPDDWNWDLAALESYQYAASLACENADPRFGVLATAATVLLNDSGRSTEAQALAEHALDQPGLEPGDEARLLMAVTTSLALGGDQQVAVAVAERAYRSALSLGEDGLAFQARGALIYAIADSDPARSRLLVREQVAATGRPDQLADPLNDLAWTALIRGDLAAAEASAARLLALRGDALDLEERHTCGAIALAAGDHPRAAALFEEGVARATGTKILLDLVEGLGAAATGSGDPGRGLRLLAGAASGRRRQGLRNHGWWA